MTVPADPREALLAAMFSVLGWHARKLADGTIDGFSTGILRGDPDNPDWRAVARDVLAALNDAGYTLAARQDEPSPALRDVAVRLRAALIRVPYHRNPNVPDGEPFGYPLGYTCPTCRVLIEAEEVLGPFDFAADPEFAANPPQTREENR